MQHDQEFYISVAVYGFFGMFIIVILLLVVWNLRLRRQMKKDQLTKEIQEDMFKEEKLNGVQH